MPNTVNVARIRRGDDFAAQVVLRDENGLQFDLETSAIVKASLLNAATDEVLIAEKALRSTDANADWPRSILGLSFTDTETSTIPTSVSQAVIKIKVTRGDFTQSTELDAVIA